ncbi:Histidyl-tRNA synthetase [hydrothermal vent metagenome]|uniref:histidine--tRNA ligase n=1 Tax=hydrothermal vent metagenome TaxID=652676 RepID=A0A3B0RKQ0_9ZZZZ
MSSKKPKKTFRPKPRKAKGFEDRHGAILRAEQALIQSTLAVFDAHGFAPLATPSFEYADVLGKFLPDEERPNAGVFAIEDDDRQWLALRYDHTAPLARFVAEHYDALAKPFRRYAAGPVWRNEKPGPGRFREFIQIDADTVGTASPAADAEMVLLAAEVMQAAGLKPTEFTIQISDRRLLDVLLSDLGVAETEAGIAQKGTVLRAIDKLERLGESAVERLLGDGRKDQSGDFTKGAGLSATAIAQVLRFTRTATSGRSQTLAALQNLLGSGAVGKAALDDLSRMEQLISAAGWEDTAIRFNPAIVRGLGYYTGPVFEADITLDVTDAKGRPMRFGSVGGGGRYDGLVARFKGIEVPATGFSFGVSRFAALMAGLGRLGDLDQGPVVILALEPQQMSAYFAMADELRAANIRAEVYMGTSGMKAQMKYADKRNAPAVVIVGEDERTAGTVTVKDLGLGSKMSKQITDNTEWRQGRPAQTTGKRDELLALVQAALS